MHPTAALIFMCLLTLAPSSIANRYSSQRHVSHSSSAQPLNLERERLVQQYLHTSPQGINVPNLLIPSQVGGYAPTPYTYRSQSPRNVNFVNLSPRQGLPLDLVTPLGKNLATSFSLDQQDTSLVWNPPHYRQSLIDYFAGEDEVQNHFTEDAYTDKDDKNFRYIVIVHTIDGLSRSVAQNGWDSYNTTYTELVRSLMEEAVVDARGAARQHTCITDDITAAIAELRDIILNPVVRFICDNMDVDTCDAVIYSVIFMKDKYELYQEGRALIALGNAASAFLSSYSSIFDAIAEQNVFLYLLNGRDDIWDLVRANAEALNLVFPDGIPLCLQNESGSSRSPLPQGLF